MWRSSMLRDWGVPGLVLVALYLSLVLYARVSLPFSPFFDQAFLFDQLQTLVDDYEARFPKILDTSWQETQRSRTDERFCVAVVSVDRPKPFLLATLGSVLSGGVPPQSILVYRPFRHDRWLDSLGNLSLVRLNISEEEAKEWQVHSPLENLHYILALESACLDKDFLVVLEDDALVTSNFKRKIYEVIDRLTVTPTKYPLGYVKLSFTNNLLNDHLFKFLSVHLYAYTLALSLPFQALGLCLFENSRRQLIFRTLAIWLVVMVVLLSLGKDTVRSTLWARWAWFTAARFKSTVGLMFPRRYISRIATCMRRDYFPGAGTDFVLGYCLQDTLNLSTLMYYPHLVQHIGFASARTAEILPDGVFLHSAYFQP